MARKIELDMNSMLKNTPYESKSAVIGIALSGGRDSVALAYALKKAELNVVAINIEHGIRGERSIADSAFAERFCKENEIPFLGFSVDAPTFAKENGYTLEQGARILRYQIFDKVLDENKCDLIALAHHLDDQVETVFMRILRGTGLNGLCGMREINGRYIRPFLSYTREDIDAYIAENSLDFVDDESNDDTSYTRNFLRKEIENLRQRFPNICYSVARLCKNAREENDFINTFVPPVSVGRGESSIGIDDLKNNLSAIQKRLVVKAVNALGVFQDIEDRHFAQIFRLTDSENGKRICLPHGITAHKDGNNIVFSKESPGNVDFKEEIFSLEQCAKFNLAAERIAREDFEKEWRTEREKGALYFDFDKLPENAVIRLRKDGDSILKFGGGRKNLGDFLTDRKVPLRKRDTIAVIASGSEIYAVVGVEISSLVRIDDHSVNIVKILPPPDISE